MLGSCGVAYASSSHTKREEPRDRRPAAQARRGTAAASGRLSARRAWRSSPAPRPIARHGLNARKMSPNRTLSTGMPTQNRTKTNVGARFAVCDCAPARPAHTTTPNSAMPIRPQSDLDDRAGRRGPRARVRVLEARRRPQDRERDERDDEHGGRGPAEEPRRDRQVLTADDAVGERVERRAAPRTQLRGVAPRQTRACRSPVPCSSISKIPSAFALKRVRAEPPAGTFTYCRSRGCGPRTRRWSGTAGGRSRRCRTSACAPRRTRAGRRGCGSSRRAAAAAASCVCVSAWRGGRRRRGRRLGAAGARRRSR